MVNGVTAAATAIERPTDLVNAGVLLSVTVAVKLAVPLAVGVPEIAPACVSVRPAGRVPDVIDHV
jgi:hypothetical protein